LPGDEVGVQGEIDFERWERAEETQWEYEAPVEDAWDEEAPPNEFGGGISMEQITSEHEEESDDDFVAPRGGGLNGLWALGECLGVVALPALVALLPWWAYGWFSGVYAPGFPYAGSLTEALALGLKPDPGHWWMFPWDIVMRPQWFDGWVHSPGGMVLFLGLPGLFWGGRWCKWLGAFSILGGLALYGYCRSGQALLPFFVPMLVVAAAGIARAPRWRGALLALALAYFAYQLGLDGLRVARDARAVASREARDTYRAFREPYRDAYGWINKNAGPGEVVLSLDPQAYFVRNATYRNYAALARGAGRTPQEWKAWLKARGIVYALVPRERTNAAPGYAGSGLERAVEELVADREVFRLVVKYTAQDGTVDVYRVSQ
jgi:hypothetical protein